MRHHLKIALLTLFFGAAAARADTPFADVHEIVNTKMCKVFGSGGFKNLVAYGTGLVVSKDGYVLTVASPLLDTRDLRVHLSDGRRYSHCKVVVVEPELDIALIKINTTEKNLDLPYFDLAAEAKKPLAKIGQGILAFSNQFEIATRDEPMSIQQGIVMAVTKLQGRRGIHEASFHGNVYILDAVTNNPGAAGGALTDRKGNLLGILGKELKNELSNTWLNYAVPIQTAVEVEEQGGTKRTASILEIVDKKEKYVKLDRPRVEKADNYTGLVLVPNVVDVTPPYVEEVASGSPAAKAGLQPDDLIVYIDGEQVPSITDLTKIFNKIRPDTTVKLEVRRGDVLKTLTMVVGKPLPKKPPQK